MKRQSWHIFRLSLLCHVTQIVATATRPDAMELDQAEVKTEWSQYIESVTGNVSSSHPSEQWVTEQCLPFLRSSAILFHFSTSVPFPKLDDAYDNWAEAALWLRYLGVEHGIGSVVCESWAKQLTSLWTTNTRPVPPWVFPVQSQGLITLPADYSELINVASLFTCPNSEGDEARTPAMCLVCGKMLCSQSYCCQTELDTQQVGACTAHAQVCGLGACLFLRVRECKLLLMAGKTKGKSSRLKRN